MRPTKRPPEKHEGFEVQVSGIRVSLGRAGTVVLASAVAAVLYAIANCW